MNYSPILKIDEFESNHLFIKREDLLPFSFGGNKARKAQLYFNDIDSGNYDCIVTYGSSSSNHCRVISNIAASRKIDCYIISPLEESQPTFNSQLMLLFGAKIISVPVCKVKSEIERILNSLKEYGKKPYFIPGGGHGNIGTQAYVNCYWEIKKYENKKDIFFDYIFFASGTGTTQAGLVCGQLIHRDPRKIIGISIARKLPRGRDIIIDSINQYLLSKDIIISDDIINTSVNFIDDYTIDGYGKRNENIVRTVEHVMRQYGIPLDSTYTGKAFYGMQKYLQANYINGRNILFIHTGGTPLFFDFLRT